MLAKDKPMTKAQQAAHNQPMEEKKKFTNT